MADYLTAHWRWRRRRCSWSRTPQHRPNLDYSRRLLDREGIDTSDGVLLVSNGFHLTRAGMFGGAGGL